MTNQLNWITDSDLESCVREVIIKGLQGIQKSKKDIARNSLDPFSALFDASLQSITLSEWLISEQRRQAQKTLQNALGIFINRSYLVFKIAIFQMKTLLIWSMIIDK